MGTAHYTDISQAVDGVEATIAYASSSSDQPAGIRGSLAYMSPEQTVGLPNTSASDVFSFGLSFGGSEFANRVDEPYRDFLSAMFAHDPVQRPPMTEVARMLATIDLS